MYISQEEQESLFGDEQKCSYFINELNNALGCFVDRELSIVVFKTLEPKLQLNAAKRGFENKVFICRLYQHVSIFRVEIEELLRLHSPNLVFDIFKRKSKLGWEMDVHIYGNANVVNEKIYERIDEDNNKTTLEVTLRFDDCTGEYYFSLGYMVYRNGAGGAGSTLYLNHYVGCDQSHYPLCILRGLCEYDPKYHKLKEYFAEELNDFFNETLLLVGLKETDYCHTFYQKIMFGLNKSGKSLDDLVRRFKLDEKAVRSWKDYDNLVKTYAGEKTPSDFTPELGVKVCEYLGVEADWVLRGVPLWEIEAKKRSDSVVY
jgi:hypothetical protein